MMSALWLFIFVIFVSVNSRSGPPTPNETLPYWLIDAPFQHLHLGEMPSSTNITIIGSGASGSSTVYHLIKYLNEIKSNIKTSILLLDARGASGGATGRNGGGLGVSGSGTFSNTLSKYGEKAAMDRYNFSLQTVEFVTSYISSHEYLQDTIQTGFGMGPLNYTDIPSTEASMEIFKQYVGSAMNESILYKQETDKYSHSNEWEASTYDGNSSFFWPAKLVFGLINDSILMSNNPMHIDKNNAVDLNIQFETTVVSVTKRNDNKWEIKTNNNDDKIISDIVVFATNAYSSYLLPEYNERIVPTKNQVLMSEAWDYFIWPLVSSGFGDEYEYWSQRIQDNKIMIGGGRNAVNKNENEWLDNYNDSYIDKNVSNYLQTYLSHLYPEIANCTNGEIEIQIEWQGIMGFSNDYIPWIGPLTNDTNENGYICAGFTDY